MEASYLDKLRFDPRLKNTFIARYLANPRLVILLVLLVLIVGLFSYANIERTLNPEIKIPIVIVSTVLPGASPDDVESLVTVPIEDAVSGIENVKQVTSTSRDSVSVVTLEFQSKVDPEKAKSDVQSAVDSVTTLPKDAQTPKVQKLDFQRTPVWTFTISSKSDLASLMRFSKILQDRLKDVNTIDEVNVNGLDEQEIQVLIKPEAISTYGINPLTLSQLVKTAVGSFPAGNVFTTQSSLGISIDPQATSVDELRNLRISIDGKPVLLSEVATITEASKPDQFASYYADQHTTAQRSVTFSIFKTKTTTINKSVADAHTVVDDAIKQYGNQFKVVSVMDAAEQTNTQFNELLRDFWITVTLIFIALFIFLGLRQAIVASLSIPLTFLVVFTIMNMTGVALSFIAFFSLLLALGLVVDDTIVVISAMTAYYRTGKFTPLETGLLVWRDFLIAVLTTTITTVWAFIPLLLASGIIGEFIKPIPIIVSTALLGSIAIALIITLPFIIILLKPTIPRRVKILLGVVAFIILVVMFFSFVPKSMLLPLQLLIFIAFIFLTYRVRNALVTTIRGRFSRSPVASLTKSNRTLSHVVDDGLIHFSVISNRYKRLIDRILASRSARRKTITMVIIFSLFAYLLLPLGFVVNEFFPKSDAETLYVNLELPSGTNVRQTEQEVYPILNDLRTIPEAKYVAADVGQSFSETGMGGGGGSNTVLFTIDLVKKEQRHRSSIDIAQELRKHYANYNQGTISVQEQSGGPPAGADLQITLLGDDLKLLDQYADQLQNYLKKQPGVNTINKSVKPGTSKLVFIPDQEKLSESNLTTDMVGVWLRVFASGFTLDDVTFNNEKKDVIFRLSNQTEDPEALSNINIPTQNGALPISSLGTWELKPNPTLITRQDGKRSIAVTAGVTAGYSVSTLNKNLEAYANSITLPPGYSWKTGGVNEENQNSVNSILQAMLLSFLLIIITMVVQFSSFRKALIVMLVIPLSIAGVFIIFALTHTPLSFPALIGVLALFGIVVKNSILIVDKINQNHKAGLGFRESISDAASSRLEAIALTSFTAILGLLPITLSDPLWRGLGGAIIAGLTFSGTIMLFFIPVVYYQWFNEDKK